jgi:hypothetical protein
VVDEAIVTQPPTIPLALRLAPLALVTLLALALARLDVASPTPGAALACPHPHEREGVLHCECGTPRAMAASIAAREGSSCARLGRGDALRSGAQGRMAGDALARLELPVDLNHADVDELAGLPGIGPTLAARIVAARPFAHVDELLQVEGIGPRRLADLRSRAYVD